MILAHLCSSWECRCTPSSDEEWDCDRRWLLPLEAEYHTLLLFDDEYSTWTDRPLAVPLQEQTWRDTSQPRSNLGRLYPIAARTLRACWADIFPSQRRRREYKSRRHRSGSEFPWEDRRYFCTANDDHDSNRVPNPTSAKRKNTFWKYDEMRERGFLRTWASSEIMWVIVFTLLRWMTSFWSNVKTWNR